MTDTDMCYWGAGGASDNTQEALYGLGDYTPTVLSTNPYTTTTTYNADNDTVTFISTRSLDAGEGDTYVIPLD